MSSKNNPQSRLKFRIHGVVVESWSILPLVIDTQPRMLADESQIAGAGGSNIFAGHRISKQSVVSNIYPIGCSQAKETCCRTTAGMCTWNEGFGEFRLSRQERRGPSPANNFHASPESLERVLEIQAKDPHAPTSDSVRRQQLATELDRASYGEAPVRNKTPHAYYRV